MADLKETHLRQPLNLNRNRRGLPSAGFVAVFLMLELCESVDLYGFGHCDRDILNHGPDGDFSLTARNKSMETLMAASNNKTHYYCHYYTKQGDGGIMGVSDMQNSHIFPVEHEVYRNLEACGMLNIRT